MARPPIEVECPTCRRKAVFAPSNPWRPFCSERCRGVDLGAWASGSYRVPAEAPPDGEPDVISPFPAGEPGPGRADS